MNTNPDYIVYYETALNAKEFGYNKLSEFAYTGPDKRLVSYKEAFDHNSRGNGVTAPSVFDLNYWILQKYGIFIEVYLVMVHKFKKCPYRINIYEGANSQSAKCISTHYNNINYLHFHQAIEDGLVKGFNHLKSARK